MSEYSKKVHDFLIELSIIETKAENYAAAFMLRDAANIIIDQHHNIELLLGVIKAKNE